MKEKKNESQEIVVLDEGIDINSIDDSPDACCYSSIGPIRV